MDDSISRQQTIDAILDMNIEHRVSWKDAVIDVIDELPPARSGRKKGKWILVKGSNGKDYHKCSECLHTQDITGVKNYCAVCGADMRGE